MFQRIKMIVKHNITVKSIACDIYTYLHVVKLISLINLSVLLGVVDRQW